MTVWLDRAFPPPAASRREKPPELLYGIDERPPLRILLVGGFQQVLLALMFSVYAVLAGRGIGLRGVEVAEYVSSCLFVWGIGTILQATRSRFTPGLLLMFMPNPIMLAAYIVVVAQYGLGAAMGAILVSHVVIFSLARFLPFMRALFPPEVVGVAVLMLGVSLVDVGIERSVGLDSPERVVSAGASLTAFITIAGVVVFSIWGSTTLRTIALLIGIVMGVLAAFATGVTSLEEFAAIRSVPPLAVPLLGTALPLPEFVPEAILTFLLIEIFASMDQLACVLTVDKLGSARWCRADMPLVSRALMGFSVTNLLNGCTGLITSAFSSANIGLAHSSGVMSRYVGFVAGGIQCVIAFVPAIPMLIVLTPEPVIGAILVHASAFLIVAGMDLALSRLLNAKRTFTIGLSVALGSSVMLVPEIVMWAPAWSSTIVESGAAIGAIAAMVLNGIFRIGVRRRNELTLPEQNADQVALNFLEHNGRIWGARRDVVLRAGTAVGEALEMIRQAKCAQGPVMLAASFDEFNLVCQLSYAGKLLTLVEQPPDPVAMLEAEDDTALDAAMTLVSQALVTRLTDRVQSMQRNGMVELRLHFNH